MIRTALTTEARTAGETPCADRGREHDGQGVCVHQRGPGVYSLLRGGDLPAIQVGPKRVWRIERVKLEEYIERQYRATREAIERGEVPPSGEDDEG